MSKDKIRAINDTVVVKTLKEEHEASGLVLHGKTNQIRYNYGEVVTASPNTVLKEGDLVYYDSVSGNTLRHEGKKYLVLKERDIALIMENGQE